MVEWDDGPNAKLETAAIVAELDQATRMPVLSHRPSATSTGRWLVLPPRSRRATSFRSRARDPGADELHG